MESSPVTANLLIINCLMLLLTWVLESTFGLQLERILGLFPPESSYHAPYQYLTSMFMHAGLQHLFFNMFALYMFGAVLEWHWGSARFLFYYILCGLGAGALNTLVIQVGAWRMQAAADAVLAGFTVEDFLAFVREYASQAYYSHLAMHPALDGPPTPELIAKASDIMHALIEARLNIPMVGASGAVYGILLGFGITYPNAELYLFFIPIPIRAKYAVILFGVLELSLGLTMPGSGIAHFAHLGGMVIGLLIMLYWRRNGHRSTF